MKKVLEGLAGILRSLEDQGIRGTKSLVADQLENFHSDNLPDPDVIAQEIVEDLEAALEQFREIVGDIGGEEVKG